jgi:DNA end-binding protein Ku
LSVAIGRVVLTSREHIIGLEPLDNGLMGTLLRYSYEVRDQKEYFDDIQDVKVTKDMLDLAKHIVAQKTPTFDPEKFEDHYEEALAELINQKRSGKTIAAKGQEAKRPLPVRRRCCYRSAASGRRRPKPRRRTSQPPQRRGSGRDLWQRVNLLLTISVQPPTRLGLGSEAI